MKQRRNRARVNRQCWTCVVCVRLEGVLSFLGSSVYLSDGAELGLVFLHSLLHLTKARRIQGSMIIPRFLERMVPVSFGY